MKNNGFSKNDNKENKIWFKKSFILSDKLKIRAKTRPNYVIKIK